MDRVLPPQPLRPGRLGATGKGLTPATWKASGGVVAARSRADGIIALSPSAMAGLVGSREARVRVAGWRIGRERFQPHVSLGSTKAQIN